MRAGDAARLLSGVPGHNHQPGHSHSPPSSGPHRACSSRCRPRGPGDVGAADPASGGRDRAGSAVLRRLRLATVPRRLTSRPAPPRRSSSPPPDATTHRFASTTQRRAGSPRSAPGSTGCRSRSSSPPPASDYSRRSRLPHAWTTRSQRSRAGRATPPNANARCAPRSTGATACSTRANRRHSPASPSSPAARRQKTPRRSPHQTSTRSKASRESTPAPALGRPQPQGSPGDARNRACYARALLDPAEDETETRSRHCRRYVELATEAEQHLFTQPNPSG